MKQFETFSTQKILPNAYFIVRVDGRGFHKEVKKLDLARPFDKRLRDALVDASKAVMKDFQTSLAYCESDEVSFLFKRSYDKYDRRQEKLVSLIAAKMSIEFCNAIGSKTSTFDARIVTLPTLEDVKDYFDWRLKDSSVNCLSSYCFWKLVDSGMSTTAAQKSLNNKKHADKNKLLFKEFNTNYAKLPKWQKNGTIIFWNPYLKEGYNPITEEAVTCIRYDLVSKELGHNLIHSQRDELAYLVSGIDLGK